VPFVVYIDETGDHVLQTIDTDFPVFVLTMLILDISEYCASVIPSVTSFKLEWFGHEGVVLHSRDIRKKQNAFSFLSDPAKHSQFCDQLNGIMGKSDYKLIASVIRKTGHHKQYGAWAYNPYHLALKFSLERLLPLLETSGQSEVHLIAESRGKREDEELARSFRSVVTRGTEFIGPERFSKIQFLLEYRPKIANLIGHQLADLAGYPIARYAINPTAINKPFDIIRPKFYRGPGWIHGLKFFP
jgi:hypothetical protein